MRTFIPFLAIAAGLLLPTLFPGSVMAQSAPAQSPSPRPAPAPSAPAPSITILAQDGQTSLRGLSAVTDNIVWVSGSNGKVGRSLDGGKTWTWITVPGYEKKDFRDIEAFDAKTAVIMAIAEPAVILKTTDGGQTWKKVYENTTPGMFLDAMEFWNINSGIVLGDPIKGRFFVARTFDGGDHWQDIPFMELPAADSGEACFASSGTNVRSLDRDEACFISGGLRSRLFIRDKAIDLPLVQGRTSTGANSIAVGDHNKLKGGQQLVIVGGDFTHDTAREQNACLSHDGGKTWIIPAEPPHGYRSCVEFTGPNRLIACGTSGVDISSDGGLHWQLIANTGFHVCRKAKKGKAVFLAGGGGRIGRLTP